MKFDSELYELTKDLFMYPQLLKNVEVTDKNKCMGDKALIDYKESLEKELADEGRILLRKSGTENLVRIMVEAKEDSICKDYCEKIANKIKELGYIK